MCDEERAWDRLDHGDSVHRVPIGAGPELAARDLAETPDWDAVLSGSTRSSFTDGAAGGARGIPGGGSVDLTAATNMLNCRQPGNCTEAQMAASSRERPWGINNPRWQLYAYGPIDRLAPLLRPAPGYLAVWIADDGREQDGDPGLDAADEESGHGIVRIHAETFAAGGSKRVIEAEVRRACRGEAAGACLPGIRVQSWQELRLSIP
jgi:hypothetical protein